MLVLVFITKTGAQRSFGPNLVFLEKSEKRFSLGPRPLAHNTTVFHGREEGATFAAFANASRFVSCTRSGLAEPTRRFGATSRGVLQG